MKIREARLSMLQLFDQTVYVQIKQNTFNLFHVQNNRQAQIQAPSPFATKRLAIGNFNSAELTLKKGLDQVYPKSLFRVSPVVIMHQLYLSEGGLCEVEERILRELAVVTGARQVYIWQGETLSKDQLLGKVYEGNALLCH